MKLLSRLSAPHPRAQLLIPWLVNGSLPADAAPALREHLASCPQCREDYEEQVRVREAMRAEGPLVFAAESSYQKLLARIQNPDTDREPRPAAGGRGRSQATSSSRRTSAAVRWLAAAVILQAFALGLGAWMWPASRAGTDAHYMTLTSAGPSYDSGPRARVLFRTSLSVGALRTMLREAGAHIIDGPADGDVYTLGFSPPPASRAALEKRIAALRAKPGVLFAEPVQDSVR